MHSPAAQVAVHGGLGFLTHVLKRAVVGISQRQFLGAAHNSVEAFEIRLVQMGFEQLLVVSAAVSKAGFCLAGNFPFNAASRKTAKTSMRFHGQDYAGGGSVHGSIFIEHAGRRSGTLVPWA